jgi:molecular chaperone DnaK (HSP70)
MSASAAFAECSQCRQWETAGDDSYCSFCGALLLSLEIEPRALVLISAIAASKELKLRNEGPRAMQVTIAPRSGAPTPGVLFEPDGPITIVARGVAAVRVRVDEKKLPAGFHRVLDYACVVDGDTRKTRLFRLDVRSGPAPKLSLTALDFGDVEEGKAVQRSFELANAGGVPLRIRAIGGEGSPHLRLESDYADRLVAPGERLLVPVVWEGAAGAPLAPGNSPAGVRVAFINHPDILFVPASARVFRYRLETKPKSVRWNPALASRESTKQVRIENNGTTDVDVVAIEGDQPWIHVVSRATQFTLLCAESRSAVSPTTFARSFDFKIVVRPRGLDPGKHQGAVTVRPHGQEPLVIPVEIVLHEPKPYPEYIGIDFGTTNSVVAVLNPRRLGKVDFVELVRDEQSNQTLIPSVLVFEDAETWKIGQAARNEADTAPDRTVRSIKRVMGYHRERVFFDRSYSASDLASMIIRKLVHLAEDKVQADANGTQYEVRKAIITVPANFYDLQILDVLRACHAAGLDTEEARAKEAAERQREAVGETVNEGIILDEPAAAALYYIDFLRRSRSAVEITEAIARPGGLRLLVFDYGGGTLDVAVTNVTLLRDGSTGLRILANRGDNRIGGDHIDVVIMAELLRRCRGAMRNFEIDTTLVECNLKDLERRRESEGWSDDVWRRLLGVRAQWKDVAEQVKKRIAQGKQTPVDVLPDLMIRIAGGAIEKAPRAARIEPLSKETVNDLLRGVLARCEGLVRNVLADAQVAPGEIDYLLHTGRQSLLPQVRRCVRGLFPALTDRHDILEEEHLKICVAKGAALHGYMRDRIGGSGARIVFLSGGRRLPHSYGVETFSSPFEPEFDEIIRRGVEYPTEKEKTYSAAMIPRGGRLNLKFYQNAGTSSAIIDNPDVSLIGQLSIDTAGSDCKVKFVIGVNRTLRIFANGHEAGIEPARLDEEESWTG